MTSLIEDRLREGSGEEPGRMEERGQSRSSASGSADGTARELLVLRVGAEGPPLSGFLLIFSSSSFVAHDAAFHIVFINTHTHTHIVIHGVNLRDNRSWSVKQEMEQETFG